MSVRRSGGREARTAWRVLRRFPASGRSWLELHPDTGRTHQIRVHAAYVGCPVWGDKLYGRSDAEFIQWASRPHDRDHGERHLLHASALEFTHPATGDRLILKDDPSHLLLLLRGDEARAG